MDNIDSTIRRQKGYQIAQAKRIKAVGSVWVVPSETHTGSYVVRGASATADCSCTCPDFEKRRMPCKHVFAVQFARGRITAANDIDVLPITYSQDWAAYNAAQCSEKEQVKKLLRELCDGVVAPPQHRGRPRLPLADVIFSSVMKVYSTVSGRRASTDIKQAHTEGHIQKAPHYNSISLHMRDPALTPILKALIEDSALPLKAVENAFAVDATGFSTSVYTRWYDQKWGRKRKAATWIKAHAMIGVRTNVVTSVEITPGRANDAPQFAGLVRKTADNFAVGDVTADKAYLSAKHLDVVEEVGGTAYIPFKLNSKNNSHGAWSRLWHLYHCHHEAFMDHYHKRSNVESTFSAIKRLFGGHLRSKTYDSQTNEALCKILAYNLTCLVHSMFALGVNPSLKKAA